MPMTNDTPLFLYTLRLADDALVLGHRLSEWCGHAPVLEEDLALGNMALDLIGQARSLYAYAGQLEARERDEDTLAYRRDAGEYRNVLLVEQPNGDFAVTILRQLLYAACAHPYFEALTKWTIRLGDGTEESHRRAQQALDDLWPYTGEMFETDDIERALIEAGVAVDRAGVRPRWQRTLVPILAEANLQLPAGDWMQSGGRAGRHSEHLGHILAELQFLQRAYPGARW